MRQAEAGRVLRELREARGWSAARRAGELQGQAKRAGRVLPSRESLVRRIYDWEAGTYRPRDYTLFILVNANADELASRTVAKGSALDRLMSTLGLMGVPMDRRKFLLNTAALAVGASLEPTPMSLAR